MTRGQLAILIALGTLAAAPGLAQPLPGPVVVGVGIRVRIAAPAVRRDQYVGRIDSLDRDELVLDTAGVRRRLGFETGPVLVESFRLVRLRTSAIERIEASAGHARVGSTIKWALIGGVGGGLLIGFGQAPEVNPTFADFRKGFPVGFLFGAAIGGAVGFALGGERWVPAAMPSP